MRRQVLGVGVDFLDAEQAEERLHAFLAGGTHLVATANAEMLFRAARDPKLAAALAAADLVLPDGAGVVLAGRLLGYGRFPRLPGVELAEALLAEGPPTFLLGGRPGVAAAAAEHLVERHRAVRVVGTAQGYFTRAEESAVLDAVRRAAPALLLVGLGSPRQERWLAAHREALGVPLAMGVGGALDVFAGRVPRAPAWMGRVGLEWLFRLAVQPRRWRRSLVLPAFVWAVLRERGKGR